MASRKDHKILLEEWEMPTKWYNIVADLPQPPPPSLHPGTHEPIGPEALAHLFPMELIKQATPPLQTSTPAPLSQSFTFALRK